MISENVPIRTERGKGLRGARKLQQYYEIWQERFNKKNTHYYRLDYELHLLRRYHYYFRIVAAISSKI
jgi:hypothetical protein